MPGEDVEASVSGRRGSDPFRKRLPTLLYRIGSVPDRDA